MIDKNILIEKLMTVYDPEFPLVDIYTLWLIYAIDVEDKSIATEDKSWIEKWGECANVWNNTMAWGVVKITMTFTTPACPMGDMIEEMVRNALLEVVPTYEVKIEVTFDPMWEVDMIKDEDVKKLYFL